MTAIHFFFNSKNLKIAYMTRKQPLGKSLLPVVVFLSGYRSSMMGIKASYIDTIAENMPFDYLRFDYSGHGESEGIFSDLTLSDWINDSQEIIEHICGTMRPVILVGSSMGGWIGIKLFERLKNPITHFIGLAPAPDFTNILMKEYRETTDFKQQIADKGYVKAKCDYGGDDFIITEKFLTDADNNAVLDKPIFFEAPVHIIQGMQDTDVPYRHALLLAETLTSQQIKIELLKSSNHRLSEPHELFVIKNAIMGIFNNAII